MKRTRRVGAPPEGSEDYPGRRGGSRRPDGQARPPYFGARAGVGHHGAVIGIFAVWANRQLLNPDNWADTSTKLLQNEKVREATSNYLVDQLYAHVNVQQELSAKLPAQLQPLAGPLAGAIRNLAPRPDVRLARRKAANRSTDGVVSEVSLNLASITTEITNRLGLPDVELQAAAERGQAEDPQVQPAQVRPGRRQRAEELGAAVDDHRAVALRAGDLPRRRTPSAHADVRRGGAHLRRRARLGRSCTPRGRG